MNNTGDLMGAAENAYRLFAQWLELDGAAREALLDLARSDNSEVHARLQQLIFADSEAHRQSFMAAGAIEDAAVGDNTADADSERSGERIGNWELERSLGAGGMGHVWLAHRCDGLHEGKAAIKMLRVVVADERTNKRFAQEGRILARLTHPHIAMLLDAGFTSDGQRYLVLEHVDGERIDYWCDAHRLDIGARLELFLQVCAAVAYAHANLIVHRDLKPSNILVLRDGSAKLLDFGIAKLLESEAETVTQMTGDAGNAMTPGYAAPEQVSGGLITTATDVYALGVILFGLLGGASPYGQDSLTPLQLARAVLEVEPKRLSDQVGGDIEPVATARSSTPDRLRRNLRGDLDTIVAKALKKNPVERYASVQALADDVRRHLAHLPIAARADSTFYRTCKFLRRHWIGAAAVGAITLAIAAGFAASVWQAHRAEHEAARAVAVKHFLVELFDATRNGNTGIKIRQQTVGDLLANGADRLKTELRDQPDVRDEIYTMLVEIFDSSGDQDRSLELARERVRAAEEAYGTHDVRVASSLTMLAGVFINRDMDAQAAPLLARSEALLDSAKDQESLERARLWLWQGMYELHTIKPRRFDGSPLLRAVELLRRRYPKEDDLEVALGVYVILAGGAGHLSEAEQAADELRSRAIARSGDNIYVAYADMTMASVLLKERKYDLALTRAQEARSGMAKFEGEHHPDIFMAEASIIDALTGLGRKDEAREHFARFNAQRLQEQPDNKRVAAYFARLAEKLQ
ncbi:MAG: serine/threonine-protein kinase [Dokdonella sp.]